MTDSSSERIWDQAVQVGLRNREVVELARRHCLDLEFVPSGGRGEVEAQTGLPVDMRQIRCPVALGDMSSDLWWIAADFQRKIARGSPGSPSRCLEHAHESVRLRERSRSSSDTRVQRHPK